MSNDTCRKTSQLENNFGKKLLMSGHGSSHRQGKQNEPLLNFQEYIA
jgi:hypothetical protein